MAIPQQAMDLQSKVQKIVLAGMTLMYAPQTRQILLGGIGANAPMPQKLAQEIAGVMKLIDSKSQSGLPPETVAPAAIMLMYEMASFMKQSGAGNPTQKDIVDALKILQQLLAKVFSTSGKAVTGGQPQAPQSAGQPPMPAPQAAPQGMIQQPMGA